MIAAQQPCSTCEPHDRTPRAGWEPHGDNSEAGSAPPPSKHTPASLGQKVWNEHHRYCLLRSKWFRGGTWVETKEKKGAVYLCNCKLVSTQRKSIRLSLPAVLLCCCRVGWSADKNSRITIVNLVGGTNSWPVFLFRHLSRNSVDVSICKKKKTLGVCCSLDLHATVSQKIRELNNHWNQINFQQNKMKKARL